MAKIEYKSPGAYITAVLFSLPNTALIWFIIMYPVYGLTGTTMHPLFHVSTCIFIFFIIWSWALLGSQNIREIIYRTCRLGSIFALLLPVVTGLVSLFWVTTDAGRPPGFLSGYSAFEIPAYAVAGALLLIILFLTGSYLAARKMEGVPF